MPSSAPDVGRNEHQPTPLGQGGREVFNKAQPNNQNRLRGLDEKLSTHGRLMVVVNQPTAIRGPDWRTMPPGRPIAAWLTRYLVGGPGWSGAGQAVVGAVVLPLSSNDPGVKVTCDSRALVTADKGNGPLCVRSFAGVGAGPACPPAGPAAVQREAAGEMGIEDIDVFIGTGRRQGASTGPRP